MDVLIEIIDRNGRCWSKALDGNLFSARGEQKVFATSVAESLFSVFHKKAI